MKEILITGAMALMMMGQQAGTTAQQQQQIPDAPKPQTPTLVPALGPVTPGAGTTPASNGDAPLPDGPGATIQQQPPVTGDPTAGQVEQGEAPQAQAPQLGSADIFTLGPLTANFIEVPFTVKDNKGRLVPGLTWRDIRVYENGVRQHMTNFTVDPFPLSIAFVIDQSMDFHTMERVNNSLGALQGALTPYDEVAVFTYNNGPKMQTDFTGGQSPRLAAVIERAKSGGRDSFGYYAGEGLSRGINVNGGAQDHINPLTAGGPGSPQGMSQQNPEREVHTLNDAILMAATATTRAGRGRRRIVYVISDGKEYGSTAKTKDVIKYLQQNKVAVYGTLVGDSAVTGMGFVNHIHLPLMMRDNLLPVYTAATGGETYAEYRTKGIETSFARITEDVRTQYTVGYYSREPLIDGKYRKLEVRVFRPSLTVIAKEGYYPTASAAGARQTETRPATATP